MLALLHYEDFARVCPSGLRLFGSERVFLRWMSRSVLAMENSQIEGQDPMKQSRTGPRLSVVVPVYNEVGTIAEVVQRVQDVSIDKEIIIVDDGSTDGTRRVLDSRTLS